jgi:hypothetical protein
MLILTLEKSASSKTDQMKPRKLISLRKCKKITSKKITACPHTDKRHYAKVCQS